MKLLEDFENAKKNLSNNKNPTQVVDLFRNLEAASAAVGDVTHPYNKEHQQFEVAVYDQALSLARKVIKNSNNMELKTLRESMQQKRQLALAQIDLAESKGTSKNSCSFIFG